MNKFIYTSLAIAAFFAANTTHLCAQSSVFAAVSAATPQTKKPQIYTTFPSHIIEFDDDECLLSVYNLDGEKVFKTMVMDGKMAVPAMMVGSIHLLDINSQTGHYSFEVAVREDDDFAENY